MPSESLPNWPENAGSITWWYYTTFAIIHKLFTNVNDFLTELEKITIFWLLKFKEFNTTESVASLTHGELLISPEERLPVPDDQYYLSDFSEFLAYSENNEFLGNIVECLELPSVNAFCISFSQEKQKDFSTKEILAPWIDDCVLDIDESAKKIIFSTQFLKSLCPEKDS